MSIQNIIQGIPANADDIQLAEYLFDPKTIMRGVALKDHELPIIEVKLKKFFQPAQVRTWLTQIKIKKKQKTNGLSHIDIAKRYLNNGRADDTLYGRSDYHRYKAGVWAIFPEIFLKGEVGELLEQIEKKNGHQFTSGQQKSIADFVRQRVVIDDKLLDSNVDLINMQNGVFSIEKQRLIPHSPNFHLTTQLPFEYERNAMCPTWIHFLRTTFVFRDLFDKWDHDQEVIDFLQEAIGYSLTASMYHHKMFWCIGEGANGKGVLFHVLQMLAGNAAIPINVDALNQNYNTYQLAMLAGKRLAYCTEVSKAFDFTNDASLKAIVAGDIMLVRQIRERPFALESICKVWISMNDFPHVRDTSYGFWRRVAVVPFNRVFTDDEAVPELKQQLEEELPGIFNWSMVGLQRLLQNEGFTQPKQVIELTAKYRLESNVVEMFVEDACDIKTAGISALISSLYQGYKDWSSHNGYRAFSRKNFKRELERLGYPEKRETAGIKILGIRLDPFGSG